MASLTMLWAMPAAGAALVLASAALGRRAPRAVALAVAVAVLVYAAWLLGFKGGPLWLEIGPEWAYGIRYALSADSLSWSLVFLTFILTVIALLASWAQDLPAGYWACFLFLESALAGVFLARDLFFFFIFWEAVLIPMFFIIGLWGSEGRRHAASKFFLFTFGGSLFLLASILAMVTLRREAAGAWSWDMAAMRGLEGGRAAPFILAGLVIGFGVKIPLVPLHTWLPDAHTEAPAAGSILLAGVMLKLGVYGLMRLALPVFPQLCWTWLPWLGGAAALNVLYGSACALAQSDLKRLIAYSSVAHLGVCLLGIFSRVPEGMAGGALQLFNHGLSTGALFLLVGFLYERAHARGISDFGELASRAPWLTFFFAFSMLSSIGLPGLNGFVGEFMSLAGMARVLPVLAVAGAGGVVLSAAYSLPAFQAVFWGPMGPRSASPRVMDLKAREKALLWPLCGLMLLLGLYPMPFLRFLEMSLQGLTP